MRKILVILPLLIICFVYGCKKEDVATPYVSFKATTVEVPASQTEYGIFVSSNSADWVLTKDEKSTWVKILGTPSRDTSATIYVEMEKNMSLEKRTATFTLSFFVDSVMTRTLTLTQLGETRAILVDIDTLYVDASGGVSTLKVNSNLPWQATSSASFITIESDGLTKTMAEKDLKLNFAPNNSLGFRLSNILIKEKDSTSQTSFVAYQYGIGELKTDSLALVDLYNATGGAGWTKKWNLNEPVTKWHGITLRNTKRGVRVVALNLAENNLIGTIPTSISDLSYLEELALQENKLSGTIPSSIGSLYLLKYLYLYSNEFTGSIPTQLANIPYLNRIHLGRNQLSGAIANEFGDLKYLNVFGVESNNLTGSLPEKLGALKDLQILYVYNNRLTGDIPNTYMKNILWNSWNVKVYICPQQNGFGFNNCPR